MRKRLYFPFQKQNLPRGLKDGSPEPDRFDDMIKPQGYD
jgi:hypothetical protein